MQEDRKLMEAFCHDLVERHEEDVAHAIKGAKVDASGEGEWGGGLGGAGTGGRGRGRGSQAAVAFMARGSLAQLGKLRRFFGGSWPVQLCM